MKKLYPVFLMLLFLFIALPILAKEDALGIAQLQGQISKAIESAINERTLYSFVKQELSNYYGKNDFSDPNKETGWYRVDNFLKWVRNNEEKLEEECFKTGSNCWSLREIVRDKWYLEQGAYYYPFWAYLGTRYIADIYGFKADFKKVEFSFTCNISNATSFFNRISLCIDSDEVIPSIINLGLHEATHMFPLDTADPLSELATFFSTYNYGLPVKSQDAITFANGVRDIRRTIALRPDLDVLLEYNYYLAGLIINSDISIDDIFSIKRKHLIDDISIAHICFYMVAMKRNNFFDSCDSKNISLVDLKNLEEQEIALLNENPDKEVYLGKRESICYGRQPTFAKLNGERVKLVYVDSSTNISQYLDNAFGKYNGSKIEHFYNSLYNKLPKQYIKEVSKNSKVQSCDSFSDWKGYQTVKRYEPEIRNAILATLEEMDVPKAKIPEGYI